MTTSGSTDFNYNRDQIIRASLRKIGAIAAGETPGAQMVQDAADALNIMAKEWDAQGIHLWTETEGTLFLQPFQSRYSLGPTSPDHATESYSQTFLTADAQAGDTSVVVSRPQPISAGDYIGVTVATGQIFWTTVNGAPNGQTVTLATALPDSAATGSNTITYTKPLLRPLRVVDARRYQMQSRIETPMTRMSRLDYRDLPNKSNVGEPTSFFYDPQLGLGQLYVWQAPLDNTDAVKFTWYRQIQDFTNAADTPDLPQEWIGALIWGLALEIAPEYDVPVQRQAALKTQFDEKFQRVTGFDVEPESIYFGFSYEPFQH
ncbi:hypothetical protein [Bradyrhizobium sp. dw_78]|uniref:phage adaptor protein n=1 Tax=Bradyrhizobium sp. dw_78 TaxID=2719793 RepID=UPI001BD424A0|nr:hypothetical protein [Bradyrhizobium sp. dw_78]